MKLRRLARWAMTTLIGVATMTSLTASAETATLRVSIEGGAFNSKFKFFDASEGCPGYNDIPGAKRYLGSVFASDKGADKRVYLGVEYYYWSNKYGVKSSPALDSDQHAVSFLAKYHF